MKTNVHEKEAIQDAVCLTVDVEWANPVVLADLVHLLDERGLLGTFFCTHPGVCVPGHEHALHPNFRRNGDTLRRMQTDLGTIASNNCSDLEVYEYVVRTTRAFCPEAIGVRGHSLFWDSNLLPIYRQVGLEYDSTYILPLRSGLSPVWMGRDMVEIPIYYSDHFDLREQATGFRLEGLQLDRPGIKVFDFHPNMVFINASTNEQYLHSKPYYTEPEKLLDLRHPGRGVRTLLIELLDHAASQARAYTATLADVNATWRAGWGVR